MGMAQPGYPRAGSRRQCEAVFWSTSLLLLLASSSAYPAMRQWRSQRKLGVHRFLLVGQPNRVPTPPHMNNPLPACRRVSLQADADVPSFLREKLQSGGEAISSPERNSQKL